MLCFGGVDSTKLTRDELLETIQARVYADQQLSILDANGEQKMIHIFAESFLNDPLMKWIGGLGDHSSDENKKDLQYKLNKSMMTWVNRPILVNKKGVVVGVTASDGTLAGAVSVMPGQSNTDTCLDLINGMIHAGAPPVYGGPTKKSYAPGGDKRSDSLDVLGKKRKELMKNEDLNYMYIQTIGVMQSHQGQGLGGKLLKTILNVADSLNIPAYLETESKENEALYQHFGFTTLEVVQVGPSGSSTDNKQPMYLMARYIGRRSS